MLWACTSVTAFLSEPRSFSTAKRSVQAMRTIKNPAGNALIPGSAQVPHWTVNPTMVMQTLDVVVKRRKPWIVKTINYFCKNVQLWNNSQEQGFIMFRMWIGTAGAEHITS